jgi:hypothetical protein
MCINAAFFSFFVTIYFLKIVLLTL